MDWKGKDIQLLNNSLSPVPTGLIRVFQFNIPTIPDSRFYPWPGGLSF